EEIKNSGTANEADGSPAAIGARKTETQNARREWTSWRAKGNAPASGRVHSGNCARACGVDVRCTRNLDALGIRAGCDEASQNGIVVIARKQTRLGDAQVDGAIEMRAVGVVVSEADLPVPSYLTLYRQVGLLRERVLKILGNRDR